MVWYKYKFGIHIVTPSSPHGSNYILEKMGAISCNEGSKIRRKPECEIACAQLEMKVGVLKDGRVCYRAGNGSCRQDGRIGSKASLICKNEGNEE